MGFILGQFLWVCEEPSSETRKGIVACVPEPFFAHLCTLNINKSPWWKTDWLPGKRKARHANCVSRKKRVTWN